jgi:hypothetical protein
VVSTFENEFIRVSGLIRISERNSRIGRAKIADEQAAAGQRRRTQ